MTLRTYTPAVDVAHDCAGHSYEAYIDVLGSRDADFVGFVSGRSDEYALLVDADVVDAETFQYFLEACQCVELAGAPLYGVAGRGGLLVLGGCGCGYVDDFVNGKFRVGLKPECDAAGESGR